MIYTASTLVCNARMRTVIRRKPIVRGMARRTIQTEHSGMEDRVTMARRAGGGQARELTSIMALLTSRVQMPPGQREVTSITAEVTSR